MNSWIAGNWKQLQLDSRFLPKHEKEEVMTDFIKLLITTKSSHPIITQWNNKYYKIQAIEISEKEFSQEAAILMSKGGGMVMGKDDEE